MTQNSNNKLVLKMKLFCLWSVKPILCITNKVKSRTRINFLTSYIWLITFFCSEFLWLQHQQKATQKRFDKQVSDWMSWHTPFTNELGVADSFWLSCVLFTLLAQHIWTNTTNNFLHNFQTKNGCHFREIFVINR